MIFARRKSRIRFLIYILILLISVLLQTTPNILSVMGVRPVLIIPFLVSIALQEGELCAAFYSTAAGLWWDWSSGQNFGLRALCLMVWITGVCFIFQYFLQAQLWTAIIACLTTAFFAQVIQMLCENRFEQMWTIDTIWSIGYTTLWIFLFYPVTAKISDFFVLPGE